MLGANARGRDAGDGPRTAVVRDGDGWAQEVGGDGTIARQWDPFRSFTLLWMSLERGVRPWELCLWISPDTGPPPASGSVRGATWGWAPGGRGVVWGERDGEEAWPAVGGMTELDGFVAGRSHMHGLGAQLPGSAAEEGREVR